jgi:hypothetical protein
MFGWPEMAAAVARVYDRLPPEDRSRCAIYASNYGEAGAIDFHGKRYSLPKAISGRNNYWLWGPRGWTGEVVILVNPPSPAGHGRLFASLRQVDVVCSRYSMPSERSVPIWVGRKLKIPVEQVWSEVKTYRFRFRSGTGEVGEHPPADAKLRLLAENRGFGRRQQAASTKRRQAARTPRSLRDVGLTPVLRDSAVEQLKWSGFLQIGRQEGEGAAQPNGSLEDEA